MSKDFPKFRVTSQGFPKALVTSQDYVEQVNKDSPRFWETSQDYLWHKVSNPRILGPSMAPKVDQMRKGQDIPRW